MIQLIINAAIGLTTIILGLFFIYAVGVGVEFLLKLFGQEAHPTDGPTLFTGFLTLSMVGAVIAVAILIGELVRSLF